MTTDVTTASTGSAASEPDGDDPKATEKRYRRARRLKLFALHTSTLVALIFIWWLITKLDLVKPLYLPSPGSVWDAFVQANTKHPISEGSDRMVVGEQNYYLWEHLIASLQRIAAGVGGGILIGIPVGLLMATTWFGVVFEPYLNFLRALPPLAYIGLLMIWFGIGDTSKIWLLFLAAFPPIAIATVQSVRSVREDQINAVRALGAGRMQTVTQVILPSSLPQILTGIRVATGFAWTTVVAAEISNGIPGIGGLAYLAGTELKSSLVIACIIVIGLAAIVLDLGLKYLEKLLVPWQGKA